MANTYRNEVKRGYDGHKYKYQYTGKLMAPFNSSHYWLYSSKVNVLWQLVEKLCGQHHVDIMLLYLHINSNCCVPFHLPTLCIASQYCWSYLVITNCCNCFSEEKE